MAGYLEHFGLSLAPFATAPDPRFAFATRAHELALLRLQDSAEQRLGLCMLKGPVGTGKSTIAHLLLQTWESDPERFAVAYLADPSAQTQAQFLRLVLAAFGLEPSRFLLENKARLRAFLVDSLAARRVVILLLDEAQTISGPNLATIQQLSNEQTSDTKLIQIALLAQPTIDRRLANHPALQSRIARRSHLEPLLFADVVQMMRHRVTVAGGDFDGLFPLPLHRLIFRASLGIPRRVCVVCDNALFNAYAAGSTHVDEAAVLSAIKACEYILEEEK